MKATEATANTAGNFIKAKGLDVANKVMADPKWYERTRDFVVGALGPEGPASSLPEYVGSVVGDGVKSAVKSLEKAVGSDR